MSVDPRLIQSFMTAAGGIAFWTGYKPLGAQNIILGLLTVAMIVQPFWPGSLVIPALQVAGAAAILFALLLQGFIRVQTGSYFKEYLKHKATTLPRQWQRHPLFVAYVALAVGLLLVNPGAATAISALWVSIDVVLLFRRGG